RWNVTKQELSFICVPISVGDEVIGTISVDRPFDENAPLDEEVRILDIVANMIANVLRVSREAAVARQELAVENLRLHRELGDGLHPENIIGNSKAMRDVYFQIQQLAQSDEVVLIRGEAGTGKELVARAIHYSSPRSDGPFTKVNCAALKDNLLEIELFGQEKKAFDGASRSRKGRLDEANGGTLYLNEIGGLSLPVQAKLLRVLQDRRFERVDGSIAVATNTRIMAASERDLEKAVDEGSFGRNLYDRINVAPIMVPPLRERKDDVLMLADHFVERYSRKMGKDVRRISTPAIDMLMVYHWPGNVRELENCIERAVRSSSDGVVHSHHLPPTLQTSDGSDTEVAGSFKDRVGLFERDLIVDALKRCNGNLTATARDLKATARIIRHRVRELGIDYKRYTSKRG
ncbi:MAG: sigma 54-interacting transcriptional regulator, partial [Phycisphaerales bacterium]